MTEILIAYCLVILAAGLIVPAFRRKQAGSVVSASVIALASFVALTFLLAGFGRANADSSIIITGWQLPFASLSAGIDPLTAFFLVPLLILAASSALYGPRYLEGHQTDAAHWLFYGFLVSGMVMVLLARNALLFLLSWEIMSLSSFLLVISNKKDPKSIHAGWLYFVTAHIGTAFLFALFLLMSNISGSFEFSAWKIASLSARQADAVFVLALIAFGLKAGFIPFHVWLPLAHPQAPSHVSAIMSGIMIKMGIYGILRMLTFAGTYHSWWGILLIAAGSVSGVLGVLFAIGQHDIKRLLAYHSVENIGIILLGIGIGITGVVSGSPFIALFGFCGGLLHILNHALFKSLLFLGAGAVIRQTGSGEIDRLGGLLKKMPGTGLLFLAGSIAICGLPFFNGFISEILIYTAAVKGAVTTSSVTLAVAGLSVLASLALIGGLAAACFTKVFGVVFLGEPRTSPVDKIRDVPVSMIAAMALLAIICAAIGLLSPVLLPVLLSPAAMLAGGAWPVETQAVFTLTATVSAILSGILAIFAAGAAGFKFIGRKKPVGQSVTWDCGYIRPAVSMQYTASSFADPVVGYFAPALNAHKEKAFPEELLPKTPWSFHSSVDDWFLSGICVPVVKMFERAFSSFGWFQNGRAGRYVAYIALIVLCLIIWKFYL